MGSEKKIGTSFKFYAEKWISFDISNNVGGSPILCDDSCDDTLVRTLFLELKFSSASHCCRRQSWDFHAKPEVLKLFRILRLLTSQQAHT